MKKGRKIITKVLLAGMCLISITLNAQKTNSGKKISSDLFGLFFEDINYSADGGLYAEQVQNRSFEYTPTEQKDWNPYSFWEYTTTGYSFGRISVETNLPIHPNNPNYMVLDVEHIGKEEKFTGVSGVGLKNSGFAGIVVKANEKYNFSMFVSQLSNQSVSFYVSLQTA